MSRVSRIVRSVRAFSREWSHVPPEQPKIVSTQPQRLKLGIALGGGFARGLAHIGVLKVLHDEGIEVDFVGGTSVGAIVGACYCAGASAEELEEIARATRFKDFARWTLSRYGFCSNDRMTRFCARVLKATAFEDLKIPLAIAATDFQSGEAVIFSKGPLVGPIRASCAYPGMFLPVEIDGRSYIDGMLGYAVPTTPLRAMGADRVIGVFLSAHWTQQRAPRHLFEVIGQCFSIAQANMCGVWKKDADLILEPDVSGFAYDSFDRAKELIALGEASARAALPQIRALLNLPDLAPHVAADIASVPAAVAAVTPQPSIAV